MKDDRAAYQYVRRIDIAQYFNRVYPELFKLDPVVFSSVPKKRVWRNVSKWLAYGLFMPPSDEFIGIFWRNPPTSEIHILVFAAWRKRWPLRSACRQVLDIFFCECDEIIAEIEDRHVEARRLMSLIGGEYRGFEQGHHCYRLTAAQRKI